MRLSERCFAVTGLGYSPPWFVNAGFIAGDEITLIVDTGANAFAGDTVLGYATAVRPHNRLRVLNTEKHFDHIGGNTVFATRGVEIWGHSGIHRSPAEFADEVAEFNQSIPNAVRRARGEANIYFAGTNLTNPEHPFDADTTFDLGNCEVEILLTPGHTPTNVCAWQPVERILYSGDCLINGYLPNLDAGGPGDWNIWLDSLRRVEALQPDVIVPGHGAVARGAGVPRVISEVRRVLEEAIAAGHPPT